MDTFMNLVNNYILYIEPFLFVVVAILFFIYYLGNSIRNKPLYQGSIIFLGISAGMYVGLVLAVMYVFIRRVY